MTFYQEVWDKEKTSVSSRSCIVFLIQFNCEPIFCYYPLHHLCYYKYSNSVEIHWIIKNNNKKKKKKKCNTNSTSPFFNDAQCYNLVILHSGTHKNLQKPRWSIFEVFFTLKTMPLSVFRYQVLRLSTE